MLLPRAFPRGIDLLCDLAYVDCDRIGMIGHSLGADTTIWTMPFEARIRAAAISGGGLMIEGDWLPYGLPYEDVLRLILGVSGATRGVSLDELRREGGAIRIRSLGPEGGTAGIYSEYRIDEPVVPLRDFVEKKRPYPTLSGRQQFYVDHPWFLEVGEQIPVPKNPPAAG